MPDTMKEYYAKLNQIKTKTPAQNALLRAIKAVNDAGDKLRKPDRYKRIPYLHADDRDKLMEAAARYGKSPYGEHLKAVAEGRIRF